MHCENCAQGPFHTLFECLLCFAIIGSYVPQAIIIIRYGTYGITSWTIVATVLFSVTQMADYLTNPYEQDVFNCVVKGNLKGFQAFSALLGYVQITLQCFCAIVTGILYITYRTPIDPDEHPRLSGITAYSINSRALKAIIATYSITTLLIAGCILYRSKPVQDDDSDDGNVGEFIIWLLAMAYLSTFWAFLLIPLMFLQYLPQILTTVALQSRENISLVSLSLQIFVFVVLGTSQGFRFRAQFGTELMSNTSWSVTYFSLGNLWINYIVAALGQIALLIVCLYVDRKKVGAQGQFRL